MPLVRTVHPAQAADLLIGFGCHNRGLDAYSAGGFDGIAGLVEPKQICVDLLQ